MHTYAFSSQEIWSDATWAWTTSDRKPKDWNFLQMQMKERKFKTGHRLHWGRDEAYKIYISKVEFPFQISLTLYYSAPKSHQLRNGPKEPWLRHNASNLDLLEYDLSPLLQQNLLRSLLLRNSLLQNLELMRLLKEMWNRPRFNCSILRLRLFLEVEDLQCTCC